MTVTAWRRINASRDHRWAQPRISEHIDGELSARAEQRILAHQELCPECAELVRSLQELVEALASLRYPPEEALSIAERTSQQVRARISEWA